MTSKTTKMNQAASTSDMQRLAELALSEDWTERVMAVRNPAITAEILNQMVKAGYSMDIIVNFFRSGWTDQLDPILNPDFPVAVMDGLIAYIESDADELFDYAGTKIVNHPATTASQLEKLTTSRHKEVREMAASRLAAA